jgi:hypothetical protein
LVHFLRSVAECATVDATRFVATAIFGQAANCING